jgi:prephenate dehydrogenase
MIPSFRQITIIGTGLIGGSFGLAVKKHGFRGKVVGCDRKPVLAKARKIRAIDAAIGDPVRACHGSDLVVLATPVGAIIDFIDKLAAHLPATVLVTDVGSTKAEIIRAADRAFGNAASERFIGGHPMAGKENAGIEFADADLFRGAVWFLIASRYWKNKRVAGFSRMIEQIGSKVMSIEATEHDRLCAWISHVPQMISTALAAALVAEYGEGAPLLEAGGRALREMTRISASPYSMWRDIALTNKTQIADALLKIEQELVHLREHLGTRELEKAFDIAHKLKSGSPQRHRHIGKADQKSNKS